MAMIRHQKMFLFSAVFLLFLSLSSVAAIKKSPVGAVVSWKGEAYVYHEDEAQATFVNGIEGIYPRDRVVTYPNSRVKIMMKDDSVISLGENGKMIVRDFSVDDATGTRTAVFKVLGGKMRTLVGRIFPNNASSFRVETTTAIAGLKGTDFIVSVGEKETEIVTISGEVSAKNAVPGIRGEVMVKPGFGVKVQEGAPPVEPSAVTSQRLSQLMEETSLPVTATIEMKELGCVSCHQKVYAAIVRNTKQHPRASEECQTCHISDMAEARKIPVDAYTTENILYLDVTETVSYSVKVRVKDRGGKEGISQDIKFTPATVADKLTDDKKAPAVSNIRIEELREGIFYSAVVTWETDRPATSQVEYGLSDKYGSASQRDDKFVREHRRLIEKLSPGEKYHLRAISGDPFGNTGRSEDFTFKVKKAFVEKTEEIQVMPSVSEIKIIKIGNKTALLWKTNKKTSSLVELSEAVSRKNITSKDPHYPGLTTLKYSGLESCQNPNCHQGSTHKRVAHPTGSVSWAKVTPAPDLPLAQGTIMVCATCHASHGSVHNYILRKEESQLCIACHKGQL